MNENTITFLRDSLNHHYNIRNSLDQKASFLVAISAIIFSLSVGHLEEVQFLILAITSFFAVFLSIMVTFMPFRRRSKKGFGLMCWWGFSDKEFDHYDGGLEEVFSSDERIAQEYKKEIWNLVNYSIKPKTQILKVASLILLCGLVGGFALFFA